MKVYSLIQGYQNPLNPKPYRSLIGTLKEPLGPRYSLIQGYWCLWAPSQGGLECRIQSLGQTLGRLLRFSQGLGFRDTTHPPSLDPKPAFALHFLSIDAKPRPDLFAPALGLEPITENRTGTHTKDFGVHHTFLSLKPLNPITSLNPPNHLNPKPRNPCNPRSSSSPRSACSRPWRLRKNFLDSCEST